MHEQDSEESKAAKQHESDDAMGYEGDRREDKPGTVPGFIINDMRTRILHLETNLPPRVQALEQSVSDMSEDIRGIRKEIGETRKETRQQIDRVFSAIQTETQAIQAQSQATKNANDVTKEKLNVITRRMTFGSGALWAMGAGLAFLAYHWDALSTLIELLEKAQ